MSIDGLEGELAALEKEARNVLGDGNLSKAVKRLEIKKLLRRYTSAARELSKLKEAYRKRVEIRNPPPREDAVITVQDILGSPEFEALHHIAFASMMFAFELFIFAMQSRNLSFEAPGLTDYPELDGPDDDTPAPGAVTTGKTI